MTTLPEIAAEARRMAEEYRKEAEFAGSEAGAVGWAAARDFDRLAEMAEPKPRSKSSAALDQIMVEYAPAMRDLAKD